MRTLSRLRLAWRRDDGTLTLFTAIAAVGLLAALGFAVDAGVKLKAGAEAESLAQQAARAGATQVNTSQAYAHGGTFTTSPAQAITAARAYLTATGHTGTITITGPRTITVRVTVTEPAVFTTLIGVSHLSATEVASATLFQGIAGEQP